MILAMNFSHDTSVLQLPRKVVLRSFAVLVLLRRNMILTRESRTLSGCLGSNRERRAVFLEKKLKLRYENIEAAEKSGF